MLVQALLLPANLLPAKQGHYCMPTSGPRRHVVHGRRFFSQDSRLEDCLRGEVRDLLPDARDRVLTFSSSVLPCRVTPGPGERANAA